MSPMHRKTGRLIQGALHTKFAASSVLPEPV